MAATAIMEQVGSHLQIARGPFFCHVRGAAGVVRGCVELEANAGPKAMNCTFWLLLPARRAIPLFSSGAASCIAFAALAAPEP